MNKIRVQFDPAILARRQGKGFLWATIAVIIVEAILFAVDFPPDYDRVRIVLDTVVGIAVAVGAADRDAIGSFREFVREHFSPGDIEDTGKNK